MIPKKLHYCWFGGKPLDKLGQRCLKSWEKYLPDYEIICWDESNFDINCCDYVRQAYEAKKWAFVSDYVRFKVLYEQGGIYFDTDVEVIKNFDDNILKKSFFGCENPCNKTPNMVNPGLGCMAEPGLNFYAEMLEAYENDSFLNADGTLNLYTIVQRTTDMLKCHGLSDTTEIQNIAGINIYPAEYFCPINMDTGKLVITDKTYSIHHYAGSWESGVNKFRGKIYRNIYRYFGANAAGIAKDIFGKRR